jgi:purine-binding chemotaxis protein CheW
MTIDDWSIGEEQQEEILATRARVLARPETGSALQQEATIRVVCFRLASEIYAVEFTCLSETAQLTALAKIPRVPSWIVGVSNLRGELFPVVDLKLMFNMPDKGLSAETKIIILRSADKILGLLTDGITGNTGIDPKLLQPLPVSLQMPGTEYIKGITSTGLILLDGEKLLQAVNTIQK